ncbi:MAG TPA: CHAT domain-containing protein [Gemmatimonadales bacterium]|nr:CHAT domain-containing protein [Gemmatimonadales bacterium]
MIGLPHLLVASLLVGAPARPMKSPPDTNPRSIVAAIVRAVESNNAEPAAAAWRARLERDSGDVAAHFALATLDRLSYRYAAAISGYTAVRALPPAQAGRFAAFAWLGEGQVHWISGHYAEATASYTAAVERARALRDAEAEALALVALGAQRLRSRDPSAAAATFDSAARLIPRTDLQLRAAYTCGRAALLARLAKPGAMREARAGAALARRAGDRRQEAGCLYAVASGYQRQGQLARAARVFDSLAVRLDQLHDRAGLAAVLQWSGYIALTRERFNDGQRLLGRAVAEASASGNRSAEAWALMNLAQVSIALADPISATSYIDRSVALMRQLGDDWGVQNALGFTGQLALATGDTARARAVFTELVGRAARTGDVPLEAEYHRSLANVAIRAKQWEVATRELDRARDLLLGAGRTPEEAAQTYERGVLALRRGDYTAARRAFEAALASADTAHRVSRVLAEARLAETWLRLGDTTQAEQRLTHASDELDAWRAGLSDSTLRVLAFQVTDEFGGASLGTASIIAAIAARGRAAEAFALAERRRARLLQDELLRTGTAPLTPSERRHGRQPSLDNIATLLPHDGVALLEYVTGPDGQPTTLFVVTRHGRRTYQVAPIDSVVTAIGRFVAIVESGMPDGAPAARLGRLLFGSALDELPVGVSDLVIVPDDALHRVPFAMLRLGGRRLVERFAIQTAPSAAVATTLWRRGSRGGRSTGRVLAFGDPAFPSDGPGLLPTTRAYFAAFADRGGLARLPASGDEARTAGALLPRSEIRLRRAASEAFLKRTSLAPYVVVHLATHARVDERALGRSAIALAAGEGEDGFVTAAELAGLRLRADLVVLSGCTTALGVSVGGEGIRGLTAPLLQAGAGAVLATLWPVGDKEAAAFAREFYAALGRGLRLANALRAAQLAAIQRNVPARAWASFVLTGNGFQRIVR